ncbi:hypothetical protein FAP59_16865 [Morganella morganii]|nr:hypothetical protein [Morganella morganii]
MCEKRLRRRDAAGQLGLTERQVQRIVIRKDDKPRSMRLIIKNYRWKATRFPVGSVTSRLNSPPSAFT